LVGRDGLVMDIVPGGVSGERKPQEQYKERHQREGREQRGGTVASEESRVRLRGDCKGQTWSD